MKRPIADAFARQQGVSQCERALDRAATFMHRDSFEQDPTPSVSYDKIWSFGFQGAVSPHLGRPQDARLALEQGLQALAPISYRHWGYYNDLILAHSLENNLEAACQSARQAMLLAHQSQASMC